MNKQSPTCEPLNLAAYNALIIQVLCHANGYFLSQIIFLMCMGDNILEKFLQKTQINLMGSI